ncbi:SixA phosphatase family protein [Chondromyces crocatus]|uniref:Phosphohistidine phosphatase n=1 Tax=Chondromyces crocatus TaxID=52 RepID=A0A0K1EDJ1_CHOCO|nr:histidine phosphatase family protein [Chondromyces crocatus]AKT38628.1 phosphohistidine phosphatase [Chondromyces crocatus]
MRLYVMRHGPAEDRSATGRDADRALTAEGKGRVQAVALHLQGQRGSTSTLRILSSPLRRARETAEIMAGVLQEAERVGASELGPELREELALDADLPQTLRLASEALGTGVDTLLVGHAPTVDHLLRSLAPGDGQKPPATVAGGFCTAMVVALEPHEAAPRWRMVDMIDPRTFRDTENHR